MNVGSRQAGVIPFRRQSGKTRFCLITTSGGGKWTFPKGIVDPGDTVRGAALREAREEAGLRGTLVGPRVGTYTQSKWGTEFTVEMYLMDVTQVDDSWDEQHLRQRRWCAGDAALALLEGRPVVDLFRTAITRLSKGRLK
jgi:8-oxo-dGTP pyrophosphatase MutT (NUDIX family)